MLELLLPLALGGSSLVMVVVSAALGLGLQGARSDLSATRDDLLRAQREAAAAQDAGAQAAVEARRAQDALARAQQDRKLHEEQTASLLDRQRASLRSLEDRVAGAGQERDQAREQLQEQRAKLTRALSDLDALRRELGAGQQEVRRLKAYLAAVGIQPGAARDPVGAAERVGSRATLRSLVASSGAEGAVLADARGLCAFAVGREVAVERLAAFTALAVELEPYFAAVLCTGVAGFGLVGLRNGEHLLRLQGTPWWLGVETEGERPDFAMRAARLALIGAPGAQAPAPELPEHVIDLDAPPDPALNRVLDAWSRRWGVQTAAVLGADTRPLAALPGSNEGAAMGLRQQVGGMLRRARRALESLDALALSAMAEDGATAQLVFTHPDQDTAAVLVVSAAPLPEAALEEIRASVRWHLDAHPTFAREAS